MNQGHAKHHCDPMVSPRPKQ